MMGGPGSGGFKNAPGDTETHSAWDVIEQEDGNTQVRAAILPESRRCGLTWDRNYRKYDVSTVLEKWRNIRLASARISLTAMTT
jgi:hypothetical protein